MRTTNASAPSAVSGTVKSAEDTAACQLEGDPTRSPDLTWKSDTLPLTGSRLLIFVVNSWPLDFLPWEPCPNGEFLLVLQGCQVINKHFCSQTQICRKSFKCLPMSREFKWSTACPMGLCNLPDTVRRELGGGVCELVCVCGGSQDRRKGHNLQEIARF